MSTSASTNTKDAFIAPEWLDNNFFLKALQKQQNNLNVEIKNIEFSLAVSNNDHFASIIYRALIEFFENSQSKQVSLILKTLPEAEGHRKEILEASKVFETEIGIYTEIMPKIESILRSVGDTTIIGPTVIDYGLSPRKFIIFEDLVPLGYETPYGEPSLEIIKSSYEKLAKLHAVSLKLIKEQPQDFKLFRHGMVRSFEKSGLFQNGPLHFIEMLGKHEELLKYKPYFETLYQDNIQGHAIDACEEFWKESNNDAFYVLCHGDFHDKNFMLKTDKDTHKLKDLMLLDFQLSYVGPIGHDLIFSMYTMLNDEERLNHFDDLLHNYFTKFQETLQIIGYCGPIPKFEEFLRQVSEQKSFAIFLLTTFMPAWYSFMHPHFDFTNCNDPNERHKIFFSNPEYLKGVRLILPTLLQRGYLGE